MSGFLCHSTTGPGVCVRDTPHEIGRGCVHYSSWAPDRHDKSEAVDS